METASSSSSSIRAVAARRQRYLSVDASALDCIIVNKGLVMIS